MKINKFTLCQSLKLVKLFLSGAFLIAFVVMVALVGFPLVCLDLALGQLGGCGPLEIWKICPAFEGTVRLWILLTVFCLDKSHELRRKRRCHGDAGWMVRVCTRLALVRQVYRDKFSRIRLICSPFSFS